MTLYDLNAEQPPSCRGRYRRGQRCDQCESPLLNPIEVRESSRKFEKVRESSRGERVLDDESRNMYKQVQETSTTTIFFASSTFFTRAGNLAPVAPAAREVVKRLGAVHFQGVDFLLQGLLQASTSQRPPADRKSQREALSWLDEQNLLLLLLMLLLAAKLRLELNQ